MYKSRYLKIVYLLSISISLVGCSQYLKSNAKTPASQAKKALYQPPKFHRVKKGETLYSIAWFYGYDYRQIALWNDIDYPYLIKPNQAIQLYPSLVRRASQNTRVTHSKKTLSKQEKARHAHRNTVRRAKRSVHRKTTKPQQTHKTQKSSYASNIKWLWPVRGKIVHRFGVKRGKKGIGISGKRGQRIVAAAAGRVVYSGSGLRGYGQLIIIKHNDTYLSAYANNKKIWVKEQQKVKLGQHIADMGSNGAKNPMLHFEIRKNGKPVNPVRYLPR